MLEELSELQTSNEKHAVTELSFTTETRETESGEIINRTYTFSYAPEWEDWMFTEYEEKRCDEASRIRDRNWRTSRHVWWHEGDPIDIDVPQTVSAELAERLNVDEVSFTL